MDIMKRNEKGARKSGNQKWKVKVSTKYYAFSYFLQLSNCFGKLKNLDFIKCRTSRKVTLKNFESWKKIAQYNNKS